MTRTGAVPVSWPGYLNRFVGRTSELTLLHELGADQSAARSARLVTLVGRGGVGKTRLAAEFATLVSRPTSGSAASDGIGWVELGLLSDPDQLPHAVATAVGLPHGDGTNLIGVLARFLAPRAQLLVLDGCQRLAPSCRALAEALLSDCPRLVLIATSRVRLGSPLEHAVRLPGLSEAAQLFLDRAAVTEPSSTSGDLDRSPVDVVCERVGGLPLAVELLAGCTVSDSAGELWSRLESRAGAGADRRPGVATVLDFAWRLLSAREQRVLRGLGSFAGDFTRQAAEEVAGADLAALDALTRRQLIARIADSDDATRYRMHPLVRRHADRMLSRESGENHDVRRRHLAYCVSLAERHRSEPDDRHELLPVGVQAEYEVALDWGRRVGDAGASRALLSAVGRHGARWSTAAQFRAIVEEMGLRLDRPDLSEQAESLREQAVTLMATGDRSAAASVLRESLALCHRSEDREGAAWSTLYLAELVSAGGEPELAVNQLSTVVQDFEQLGIPLGAYHGYVRLGRSRRTAGRLAEAVEAYARALALSRRWQFAIELDALLEGLAAVAVEVRRPVRAAVLLGAARTWIETFGASALVGADADRRGTERRVRTAIGDDRFATAASTGLGLDAGHIRSGADLVVIELTGACQRLTRGITEREAEVLRLVSEGLSNADIATRLGLSPRTVHAHLRSVYGKLEVGTRTAAAGQADRLGLLA